MRLSLLFTGCGQVVAFGEAALGEGWLEAGWRLGVGVGDVRVGLRVGTER